MRKSIERLLHANGYTTAAFLSAEEFLRSTVVGSAVGLVLDIHLGGMSGIELARELSARRMGMPIVFITARDDERTFAEAQSVGCVGYLQKPFETSRLLEALERMKR